jgi:hypothetical protein
VGVTLDDEKLKEIWQLIKENKTSDFTKDDHRTLWLGKQICIPNLKVYSRTNSLGSSRLSVFNPSQKHQDVQGSKEQILVVPHEARYRKVCIIV